ncbi:NACHT, LRR and PYD domains-containing protein 3 isoform X2 [Ictalurus punctatus]|uniref:NACHT, LRR and PYD domains-containing protein 3 isoform X2 n=1 Tax=Ictalurus punctatus TaxID=7998 RepID=A0A979FD49_ICTPU|nr:NACHT, LRR and PYD domains-containing protein 3 isoform X2 [Ictalurus punctatus]
METLDLDTENVSLPSKNSKLQGKRSESPAPSCISMKSDQSMEPPVKFKDGDSLLLHRFLPGSPVSSHLPNTCHDVQEPGDRKEKKMTDTGRDPESAAINEFPKKFKSNLMKKFRCLNGVIINLGNQTLLNEIYTELYIIEGDSGEVNNEHEVRQLKAASKRTTEGTSIKCNDIFKPLSEQDEPIRTVLTKGVAGIGKTVSVQKFILDWAEGKANQDIHLIFPLPFRELNLMKEQKLSLVELLHVCFNETKETEMSSLEKVLFIFDGLDEYRFPLDFQNTVSVCDVTESVSVHALLINLIKGNLLPSALIWITSRPAAADQIPSECVHRVTEVRGFNDPQKEEYFRKRISDQSLANNIVTHLKSLRSLYIMCHIPVFCWISATVLERMLGEAESGEIPKTLTQMYTHFLIIQTNIIREKYSKKQESDEEMLLKLGQLAFQQLMKGNVIFYEEDLRECGIDVREAAVYSGVCTQIFREEFGFHQSKVYCFVHLSIQEHLAALYVHLTFMMEKRNVLQQNQVSEWCISHLHYSAVDQALQSQTGHLDLFLRFLLGLSLKSNQNLLYVLVTQTGSSSQSIKETVLYIKKMISEDLPTEKSINLFHCLNELGDNSLVEEIQHYLKSGKQSELSSSQWSALVFLLLTSAQELEEFDLNKYISTDKITEYVLVKVMPVIAASRKAIIRCDSLVMRSWSALVSALSSETSNLRELHLSVKTLDLSYTKLGDSGVKSLCSGLENPNCKVEILRLECCGVSDEGCAALTSALRSNPSHLRDLDLSYNNVGDSGVKSLSAVLENPQCKVETLSLYNCGVSDEGCAALTSALRSNPSHLRQLFLSSNKLGDSGVKSLSDLLENPQCKLETLRLCKCGVSDEGCAALTSALRSNPSHLRELDLYNNKIGDSGVKLLSALRDDEHYKLQILEHEFLKREDSSDTSSDCSSENSETTSDNLEDTCSTSTQNPDTVHHSAATEVFIPELGKQDHEDRNSDAYRFLCSRAGQFQCKYTNLVFEMKEKGEVMYSIVSWDSSQLDGVGQMQPAGPKYNINCFEGSICNLHLPHCETHSDKNQTELAIAHFSSGNVEIIQPLKVTGTHVIIDIENLSYFGLFKKKQHQEYPIRAQVLLFYKGITGKTKRSKLHMHLLPRNVPVEELQIRYQHNAYIETSSICLLTPGKTYRPHCQPYKHQPTKETFDCEYGPNYHPTFEVLLNAEVEELTLGLLDEHDQEVWESRQVFLTDDKREAVSPKMAKTGAKFVDKHREMFIQRISSVMEIADCLLSRNMITGEIYSTVSAEATSQEKMRALYRSLDSGGSAMKEEFYKILKEKHRYIVDDLESGSSQT